MRLLRRVAALATISLVILGACSDEDTVQPPHPLVGVWFMDGGHCNQAGCDWDSLDVTLTITGVGSSVRGSAGVKWYPLNLGGQFNGRPIVATADADSLRMDVHIEAPTDPDNLRFRLAINGQALDGLVRIFDPQEPEEFPARFVKQ